MKKTLFFLSFLAAATFASANPEKKTDSYQVQRLQTFTSENSVNDRRIETMQLKTQKPKKTAPKSSAKTVANQSQKVTASKQEIAEGKLLLSKSDCLGCHKLEIKLVGPAYSDVAKKYTLTDTNLNLLAMKIIKGGSGTWGPIPMSPHPSVTGTDAKKMVKYILSLNTKATK